MTPDTHKDVVQSFTSQAEPKDVGRIAQAGNGMQNLVGHGGQVVG